MRHTATVTVITNLNAHRSEAVRMYTQALALTGWLAHHPSPGQTLASLAVQALLKRLHLTLQFLYGLFDLS